MADIDLRNYERLAALEALMTVSTQDRSSIKLSVERVRLDVDELRRENIETMKEIVDKINDIDKKLSRYTGFWGGIVMIGGAIWSFFALFWKAISVKLGLGA